MPEPVLVSIAAALAAKSITGVYELVKTKFAKRAEAAAALEAAEGAAPDSAEVAALADELARAEKADPAFHTELRSEWAKVAVHQQAEHGGVVNQITGNVSGKVLQARDIQGGVTF
ncbi:hypothetical protein [Actinokineospora iranica]|uniref:Uncharacterized protein n=1 Tax=Actinokineospora iranica TaxID=1271860 RepID=A0A1G6MBB6_9PSEU|nr:hypothetical protein [Actinokineospora iranica]SDC52574.1 hypothetical protein SAMN05216174_102454 [Actinokineospora iranica]